MQISGSPPPPTDTETPMASLWLVTRLTASYSPFWVLCFLFSETLDRFLPRIFIRWFIIFWLILGILDVVLTQIISG
jgi:hypothetical protein